MENQSVSKKGRMDCHPGSDLLSDLPLSIIHIILALVPTRDAIRTSILSRQWRYKWTSLPELVFDDECVNRRGKSLEEYDECMQNFITNALFRHNGLIHKFKMYVSFESSCPRIDDWVLCLSRNDIRELILNKGDSDDSYTQRLHSSVYSCTKLNYLELWNCELDPPPSTFKGFLFLRRLILTQVYMSPNGIETLVASSPHLERLELNLYGGSELRISAPNLKHLHLSGDLIDICMNAPLLVEVRVDLDNNDFIETSVCNYRNFFGGITNLEKLSGFSYFTKFLSIGIEYCHHPLVFHHLNLIHLQDVNFQDVKEVSVVARLVIGAPNLHKLKITTKYHIREFDEADLEAPHVSYRCAPNFKLEKLKVVKMSHVTSHPLEMEFLKFLLESSSALEKMSLCPKSTLGFEEVRNLRAELLRCNLASPNAKIWIIPSQIRRY